MTKYEALVSKEHEAVDVPSVSDVGETVESRQITYDPDAIGTLTAEQDSEIEDMAYDALSSGVPAGEVQAMVYDKLAELGFDISGTIDNTLVVYYEGTDGKRSGARAITLRPDDFGVVVRNVELVAATPHAEQAADIPNIDKESPSQSRAVEEHTANVSGEIDMLSKSLVELPYENEHGAVQQKRFYEYLVNVRAELYRQGGLSQEGYHNLMSQVLGLETSMNGQMAIHDNMRVGSDRIITEISEIRSAYAAKTVDDANRDDLVRVTRFGSIAEGVGLEVIKLRTVTQDVGEQLRVLNSRVNEACNDRYGQEAHKAVILRQIESLLDLLPAKTASDKNTAVTIQELRQFKEKLQ